MLGLELQISGVGCDLSTNWATNTAKPTSSFVLGKKNPNLYFPYESRKSKLHIFASFSCFLHEVFYHVPKPGEEINLVENAILGSEPDSKDPVVQTESPKITCEELDWPWKFVTDL